MPDDSKTPELHDIKGCEIFATGTWHGDEYTTKDLDAMCEAFGKVGFKPPLKLGHSEKQHLLTNAGLPAAGWVERIYRQGGKLLADFSAIPKQIHDLILRKAYDRVSSEIYWDYSHEESKLPRVLKAVALLGSEIPEVTSLESISALYYDGTGHSFKVVEMGNTSYIKRKEEYMNEEEKERQRLEEEKKKVEAQAVTAQFQKEVNEKLATFEKQNKELQAQLAQEKALRREEQVDVKVKEFTKQMKVSPAQAPFLKALYLATSQEPFVIKFDKEEKKLTGDEAIDNFVALQTEFTSTDEKTKMGVDANDIDVRIRAYCKENSLNYSGEGYVTAMKALGIKEV